MNVLSNMRKTVGIVLLVVIVVFVGVGLINYGVFVTKKGFADSVANTTESINQLRTDLSQSEKDTNANIDAAKAAIFSQIGTTSTQLNTQINMLNTKVLISDDTARRTAAHADEELVNLQAQITVLEQTNQGLQQQIDAISKLLANRGGGGGGGGGGSSAVVPAGSSLPNGISMLDSGTVDFYSFIAETGDDELTLVYSIGMEADPPTFMYVVKRTYIISTGVWSSPTIVYDWEGGSGCPAGGVIDNSVYVFLNKNNSDNVSEVGYIKSANLTCTSWSSFAPLLTYGDNDTSISAFSSLVHASGDTYLQPYDHVSDNSSVWAVKLFKTTDAGLNWNLVTIYEGTTKYNEATIAYIGDNKLIALMRENDGGAFGQSVSSDGGNTWSAPSATNIGTVSGGIKTGTMIYDSDNQSAVVVYADRGDMTIKAVISNALAVYNNPTAWPAPRMIDDVGVQVRGYGSLIKTDTNEYFFTYTRTACSFDEDICYGYLLP